MRLWVVACFLLLKVNVIRIKIQNLVTILGFKNEISHITILKCDTKQNTDCVRLIEKIKILRNRTVA
ncbi:hypothetical protein EB796_006902 [Bugula neritina]|uniref:Uncharacterized protein n=1 Tax=Bugula neritina TaxID=10212 RepID=A0A7J7K956_BUGNE|nr:hypothetical protein EB796_006902 [Bugula neritina]